VKVEWTNHAKRQLAGIHDFIAQDSPRFALRVVDRLTRRSQQIARFPNSGRILPELDRPDVREVIEPPFRIVYRILSDRIHVVSIFHSSQLPTIPER
jgi:toxin ParE1/3/4